MSKDDNNNSNDNNDTGEKKGKFKHLHSNVYQIGPAKKPETESGSKPDSKTVKQTPDKPYKSNAIIKGTSKKEVAIKEYEAQSLNSNVVAPTSAPSETKLKENLVDITAADLDSDLMSLKELNARLKFMLTELESLISE